MTCVHSVRIQGRESGGKRDGCDCARDARGTVFCARSFGDPNGNDPRFRKGPKPCQRRGSRAIPGESGERQQRPMACSPRTNESPAFQRSFSREIASVDGAKDNRPEQPGAPVEQPHRGPRDREDQERQQIRTGDDAKGANQEDREPRKTRDGNPSAADQGRSQDEPTGKD